ncbi:MAG: hypothetical protein QNJ91_09990, partial [Gammaproteobacteria bacterium]|nr:hypothetical protein [Gammaproteobacteria bacterium]
MTLGRLLLLVLLVAVAWWLLRDDAVYHGPGVVAPQAPLQGAVDGLEPFRHRGYGVIPLARFEARARVLGREDYRSGR